MLTVNIIIHQMSRPPLLEITDPSTWKAMLSPVRVELAELLRSNGEATIADLAKMLGRPPETLYRHIAILVEAGLVVEKGYRKKSRHVERVYDLAADDYFLAFKGHGGPAENEIVVDTMSCFSRVFDRTVKHAAAKRLFEFESRPRNVLIRYEMSWLTREDVAQLHDLVARAKEIMDRGRKSREGEVYRWLAVLCPFQPGPFRSQSPKAGQTPAPVAPKKEPSRGKKPRARALSRPRASLKNQVNPPDSPPGTKDLS